MRVEDRERAVVEVSSRVVEEAVRRAGAGGPPLDELVADTVYHERKRLDKAPPSPVRDQDRAFYKEVNRSLGSASSQECRRVVERMAERFTREVVGKFDERVYRLTTGIAPSALGLLLNAVSPLKLIGSFPSLPDVSDRVELSGETRALENLSKKGTVILVPTHSSHVDSVVVGYSLFLMGLPPFTYGAGLNLFTNPLLSFFMRNLGAYRVDRRKQCFLYKDVLKEYATVSLEYGYHNLFFPGGTRSRSGEVESRLKLGLLGCGLTAYINNLRNKVANPSVYIVPCTVNFALVLEAATLIEDHLQEAGKSRYIIEDDEFSKPRQVFDFASNLFSLDSPIVMRLGQGLDPFGNRVDEDGVSLDSRGRAIDPSRYVQSNGGPGHVPQRDQVYTKEAGQAVAESFKSNSTPMATHVLAYAVFELLRAQSEEKDLYRFLRTLADGDNLPLNAAYAGLDHLTTALRKLNDESRISFLEHVTPTEPEEIVRLGLRYFGTYHNRPAVYRRGDRLFCGDANLLYYYRNRLEGYGLEQAVRAGHNN